MHRSVVSLFVDHEVIRLTANAVWLSNGEEITHQRQVEAFFRHLGKDEEGYFIQIGDNFKRIEVEDTALFVTGLEWDSEAGPKSGGVTLRLTDGTNERLQPQTLRYEELDGQGRLTCSIPRWGGQERVKFLKRPHLELLSHAEERGPETVLTITGETITLSRTLIPTK